MNNFIALSGIEEFHPAPYSPVLEPCDFWLYRKVKKKLRGRLFTSNEEIRRHSEAAKGSFQVMIQKVDL